MLHPKPTKVLNFSPQFVLSTNFMTIRESQIIPFQELNMDLQIGSLGVYSCNYNTTNLKL